VPCTAPPSAWRRCTPSSRPDVHERLATYGQKTVTLLSEGNGSVTRPALPHHSGA
jgi:hypothetical protein